MKNSLVALFLMIFSTLAFAQIEPSFSKTGLDKSGDPCKLEIFENPNHGVYLSLNYEGTTYSVFSNLIDGKIQNTNTRIMQQSNDAWSEPSGAVITVLGIGVQKMKTEILYADDGIISGIKATLTNNLIFSKKLYCKF